MIQFIAGAGAAGLLVGSLGAWFLTAQYKDARWTAATLEIKVEAAEILQRKTDEAIRVERVVVAKVRELEAQHVQEEKTLSDIQRRNRQLAAELGGLRDPGRRQSGGSAVSETPTSPGSAEHSPASGYLSAEASGVLLSAAAEVDALASYAKACYEWKEIAEQTFNQSRAEP
jgi:hypothetical protein